MFNYKEFREVEKHISKVEERVIREHFDKIVSGNDGFENKSSAEMQSAYWLFRQAWILSQMFTKKV